MTDTGTENLTLPDRYESLERKAKAELSSIVVPVDQSIEEIDRIYRDVTPSGRGAFLILRGRSGAGKSTFLHTLHLFRESVQTISVPGGVKIRDYLSSLPAHSNKLEVIVLEEREAAIGFTDSELEEMLHAINGFIRSDRGSRTLVVWPCNTDQLKYKIIHHANQIGADALLGNGSPAFDFSGPGVEQYRKIAETTVAVLNQGATFSDLGISDDQAHLLASKSETIGSYLGRVRSAILQNETYVQNLVKQEQCRLWVIVVAGNEPGAEVAALTRGRYSAVDIERLLSATEANIVQGLKDHPEKLGILGTVLDAKILHLPVLTALSIVRAYADEPLKARMRTLNLSLTPDKKSDALTRLSATELARIFKSAAQGILPRGSKIGPNTVEAFSKLAMIASSNDAALNRALGRGFMDGGLIDNFKVEQDFGSGLTRRTDILAGSGSYGDLRIEVMWRTKTSRAEISNYVLGKLHNYGKAIGFL